MTDEPPTGGSKRGAAMGAVMGTEVDEAVSPDAGVTRPEEDYARTPLAAWREDCMPLPIPWPIPD